jgi:hypothetical protein
VCVYSVEWQDWKYAVADRRSMLNGFRARARIW